MKKRNVDILIMEDNDYYKKALETELNQHFSKSNYKNNYNLSIQTFNDSEKCLHKIKECKQINNDTIAYLDFYIGHGLNGAHLLKLLKEKNKKIKVVLMSQSSNVKNKLKKLVDEKLDYDFIVKDTFTPAMCCILMEDFLESLQY